MSKSIDLVIVDAEYKNLICYAPYNTVHMGDTVITGSGNGQVVETLFTYSENDVFQFFKRNVDLIPIKAVIQNVNYEGVEI